MAITILAADLAKFTGPIGENTGKTGVRQAGICGAAAAIEASADSPAAGAAVVGERIKAASIAGVGNGLRGELVAGAAGEIVSGKKGIGKGAGQGVPTEHGLRP